MDEFDTLVLQRGDVLVLHFRRHLSPDEAARIREYAQATAPGHRVVIVDGTVDQCERREPAPERPEHRACRRQS